MNKTQIAKELATRKLENKHKSKRENLKEYLYYYWKTEKKQELDENWHIDLICEKLEAVKR